MEVPPSSDVPLEPASSPPREARDATEREACRFLSQEVVPWLARSRRPILWRAVRSATRDGALGPLGGLAERQRRDLLDVIEQRVDLGRGRASPRAIVRLTSIVGATPTSQRGLVRRLAPPAR